MHENLPGIYKKMLVLQKELMRSPHYKYSVKQKKETAMKPEYLPTKNTSANQPQKKPLLRIIFKKGVRDKTGEEGFIISGYCGKLYTKNELPLEYTKPGSPHFYLQGGNLWISGLADNDLSMIRYDAYHKMHEISISPHELCQSNFIKKEEFHKFLDNLKAAGERLTGINREIRNKKKTWKGSVTIAI